MPPPKGCCFFFLNTKPGKVPVFSGLVLLEEIIDFRDSTGIISFAPLQSRSREMSPAPVITEDCKVACLRALSWVQLKRTVTFQEQQEQQNVPTPGCLILLLWRAGAGLLLPVINLDSLQCICNNQKGSSS